MPVRWIYLLADGTMGVLNGNRFRAISNGGTPSDQNQIVGRIAWWADDETCKINVNTASVPSPWDTPRTNSAEDVMYATRQPVSGEGQQQPPGRHQPAGEHMHPSGQGHEHHQLRQERARRRIRVDHPRGP
jgi:hypothetical protein